MSRQKTVFSTNDAVAHAWAHATQYTARTGNHNFSFEGDQLYSYNTCIARRFVGVNGEPFFIITNRHYSQTTAIHKTRAWRAVPNNNIFECPVGGSSVFEALIYYEGVAKDNLSKIPGAAKPNKLKYITLCEAAVNNYNRLVDLSQGEGTLTRVLSLPANWEADKAQAQEWHRATQAKRDATQRAKNEEYYRKLEEDKQRRRQEVADKLPGAIDAWHNYENVDWSLKSYLPDLLRLKKDNHEIVETSRHAEFPLSHFLRGYKLVKACKNANETYTYNGHTIALGHYRIDSIDSEGNVKAGCHNVSFDEIQNLYELVTNRQQLEETLKQS